MIKAFITADLIVYYNKILMVEVFFSNVASLQVVKLLRNRTPSWISS